MPHGAPDPQAPESPVIDTHTLDRHSCLSLLSSMGSGGVALGRIGLSVNALPVIMPVGFRVDGQRILFGLGPSDGPPGDDTVGEFNGVVVAFEADDVDPVTGMGWTVLVRGQARVVTNPAGDTNRDWVRFGVVGPSYATGLVSVTTDVITGWVTGMVAHGDLVPVAP